MIYLNFKKHLHYFFLASLITGIFSFHQAAAQAIDSPPLPDGFAYLKMIAPTIVQDMRYAGYHNFIGRPIRGYDAPKCILSEAAAKALEQVQTELKQSRLSLKVFDCYRPTSAVDDFIEWSQIPEQQQMKTEFYPNIDKKDFFDLGYVAKKSGHSRGSTVDLTIIPLGAQANIYTPGQTLIACTSSYEQRFFDAGLDFGTGYDCLDERSHYDVEVGPVAQAHRKMLQELMKKYGFNAYDKEWWHFTLNNEPFPKQYFSFPIQ